MSGSLQFRAGGIQRLWIGTWPV